jgi:hypothetical protein
MVFGFSDFSLRVIYEALERWEDAVEGGSSELASPSADASVEASRSEPVALGEGKLASVLLSVIDAVASADAIGGDTAEDDAARAADDVLAEQQTIDLTALVLPASFSSIQEPGTPANLEAQRAAVQRVFRGYEWVARYQAIPGPSMGWQHLVDARQDDTRHEEARRERGRRAAANPPART